MTRLAVALAAVTLLRLGVAAWVPLAPDETYYWIWSHALAMGYPDHPPMVALWIRAGTILAGQTALGIRLLGPLAAALASWMVFDTARTLFPGRNAGVAAVVLLNASLLLGVGTVIMTPDSPLLFFWSAALWSAARLAAGGSGLWWLAAGVAAGLALDSKYTALFLWIGIGLWALLTPSVRPWLRRWQPWAASAIGLILFAPVLVWNAGHQWASFVRQGGRVQDWRPARAIGFLAELVGGQIGLVTPLVWVLCMAGLVTAMRIGWQRRDPRWSLLVALSLPPILVFVQHAFGDRVQGNWPAIIYPALAVAADGAAFRPRWWISASALGFAMTMLVYVQASSDLIKLPPRLDPIAMRLFGWDAFANQLETARKEVGASFVVAGNYAVTSELAWWLPAGVMVVGTDQRWRRLALPRVLLDGRIGILVTPGHGGSEPDQDLWEDASLVGTASRPGTDVYRVYRVAPRTGAELVAVSVP